MKEYFQHRERKLQRLVQQCQGTRAVEPQVTQNQIGDHRARQPYVIQVIRYHWPAILPEGFWSCIRSAHLFRNIHDPWGMVPVLNWITFQAVKPQGGDCHQFPPLELDGCTPFAPGISPGLAPYPSVLPTTMIEKVKSPVLTVSVQSRSPSLTTDEIRRAHV